MTGPASREYLESVAAARSAVQDWTTEAGLLAVVEAAHRSGLLRHLEQPRDLADLVAFAQLPAERVCPTAGPPSTC